MAEQVIRVPNLPLGQIVDSKGNATDDELTFRHILITSLQTNFGDEGVVVPTQTAADILIIQNNTDENGDFTCQAGTLLYNSDTDALMVSILVAGVPTFKTVQVV